MIIFGSGTIASRLAEHGLIDDFIFVVNPVLLGNGRTLLNGMPTSARLKLVEATPYSSGNILIRYARVELAFGMVTLDEHLFRRESGRMVAALVRIFGVHNLALAEDVVQDAFCRALEVWKARGVPENPSAWLMTTAKNRALDVLRRERTARTFAPEMGRLLETEWTTTPVVDEAFAEHTIRDEQLRMMFSCADPRLPEEVQVALILNILCGFGANEIAGAFLAGRAAVEKRISRGKKVLATSKRLFDLADADFPSRIDVVRRALYLLFNEGYHGSSAALAVREELCSEAIRLTTLLLEYRPAATPTTTALARAHVPARGATAGADCRRRSPDAPRPGTVALGLAPHRERAGPSRAGGDG